MQPILNIPGAMLDLFAFAACIVVYLLWKRTRYFGNTAPLLVGLVLPLWPARVPATETFIWTLPFIFVFIGGIYADLLEPAFFAGRFRKLVTTTVFFLVGASLVLNGMVLMGA